MIHAERRGPVALLTLDRPERRNALDLDGARSLLEVLTSVAGEGTRAVVLTGAGGHFCSGADLSTVREDQFAVTLRELLRAMVAAPVPIIAAVDGFALGAGTQLAVACDLRVATPDARFGVPAAKLGLMVDQWTARRLAVVAGEGAARSMLLTADEVDCDTAVRVGMVQKVGGLEDALAWAERIARLAPLTVQGHKLALERSIESPDDDPDVDAARTRAWSSADLEEGMAAFRERRPPEFTGS